MSDPKPPPAAAISAGTSTRCRDGSRPRHAGAIAAVALACCAVLMFTAARIETLNVAAGHFLPFNERRLDTGERLTWRDFPDAEAPRLKARSELRGVVRTWGLAQHAVAAAAIGCGLALRPRRTTAPLLADAPSPPTRNRRDWTRIVGAAAMLFGAAALALAVARGYLISALAAM